MVFLWVWKFKCCDCSFWVFFMTVEDNLHMHSDSKNTNFLSVCQFVICTLMQCGMGLHFLCGFWICCFRFLSLTLLCFLRTEFFSFGFVWSVFESGINFMQVFDLADVKPHEFVRYGLGCLEVLARLGDSCAKECRERMRVMVWESVEPMIYIFVKSGCGWWWYGWWYGCLGTLHKQGQEPVPPVGIVPLGTGNDLSRSFGWVSFLLFWLWNYWSVALPWLEFEFFYRAVLSLLPGNQPSKDHFTELQQVQFAVWIGKCSLFHLSIRLVLWSLFGGTVNSFVGTKNACPCKLPMGLEGVNE